MHERDNNVKFNLRWKYSEKKSYPKMTFYDPSIKKIAFTHISIVHDIMNIIIVFIRLYIVAAKL